MLLNEKEFEFLKMMKEVCYDEFHSIEVSSAFGIVFLQIIDNDDTMKTTPFLKLEFANLERDKHYTLEELGL